MTEGRQAVVTDRRLLGELRPKIAESMSICRRSIVEVGRWHGHFQVTSNVHQLGA